MCFTFVPSQIIWGGFQQDSKTPTKRMPVFPGHVNFVSVALETLRDFFIGIGVRHEPYHLKTDSQN